MRGKIILSNDEFIMNKYNICNSLYPYDYQIEIKMDLTEKFEDLISNTGDLDESVYMGLNVVDDRESINFFENCKSKQSQIELLKNAEYIYIDFDIRKAIKYIKQNPILKTKKIVFCDTLDKNSNMLNEISLSLGNDTNNLYFELIGNSSLINFAEYSNTVKTIDTKIKEIEKYNFSPIEKIMYIYDLTRDKIYLEVDDNQDKTISRNLSSALLGDKIVCVGYAKIFNTLLSRVGIKANEVYLMNSTNDSGHARSEIYIKDDKYDIDGVYYFDPTWDSKKKENDNSFLLSYKFFAMTKKHMDNLDNKRIIAKNFPYYSDTINIEVEEIIKKEGFEGLSEEMLKSINHMSNIITDDVVINKHFISNPIVPDFLKPNKDRVINTLNKLVKHFNKPLSANILLKALYNVRKIQYYNNPDKYPFGINEFYSTTIKSNWKFETTPEQQLIMILSGCNNRNELLKKQILNYSENTDLFKNIQQIRLTKTLKKIYEKKSTNSRIKT